MPADQIAGDTRTRVLLAVLGGASTVSEVAEHLDLARSCAHRHLTALADDDLVTYGAGRQGVLRPLVAVVHPEPQTLTLTITQEHRQDHLAEVEMTWLEGGEEHSDHASIRSDTADDLLAWARSWVANRTREA